MLVNKRIRGFTSKKKYIRGRGLIDSLSSIFNSVKPALSSVGSYLKTNKDLILKPLIGAVGQLGAKALAEGVPAIINRIHQKRNKQSNPLLPQNNSESPDPSILEDPKFKELLQNATASMPVSNIIGSGYKEKSGKRGSGIKKF